MINSIIKDIMKHGFEPFSLYKKPKSRDKYQPEIKLETKIDIRKSMNSSVYVPKPRAIHVNPLAKMRKRQDSFGDPEFVEPESPELEPSTKDLTSIIDDDIQPVDINDSAPSLEAQELYKAYRCPQEMLPSLFQVQQKRGRQDQIKSQETPGFD